MIKLPPGVDLKNLIDDLRILSWEASEILLHYSQILKDSSKKSNILKNDNDQDPVTIADIKVNEMVFEKFNQKYRGVDWEILSEENVKLQNQNSKTYCDWVWVFDPLDGTKDFIQGRSDYAMHLALNFKQKPIIGIVLIPEKNQLWIADGKKVWCERRDGSKLQSNLSKFKNLQEMSLVTSKNHRNQTLKKVIEKINFEKVLVMGSIGCKIASIIRGESDIYISLSLPGKSSPKDWDFAAPEVILKTAGGAITNLENVDLNYGKENFAQSGIIIASSDKENHGEICSQIKKIIMKYELYPF